MIEQFRRFLMTSAGRVLAVLVGLGILAYAIYSVAAWFKGDTPDTAFYTTFVDAENGKSFRHENKIGEQSPILSPYSGKNTAYPGEACYWTREGKPKKEPTWVLLNSTVGRPEPTFCPDCGRLVVGHNPQPAPGKSPPPTQAEMSAGG